MDIDKLIKAYVGKEVPVEAIEKTMKLPSGEDYTYVHCEFHDRKLMDQLVSDAKKMGLHTRVFFPNTAGTPDYRTDRLNVHIVKDDKGIWRIKSLGIG